MGAARSTSAAVLAALLVAAPAVAYDNEPAGFRSIDWGTRLETLADLSPIDDARSAYTRRGELMNIGGAELDSVLYHFWQGRFFQAVAFIKPGEPNLTALRQALAARFGPGAATSTAMVLRQWTGPTTTISLHCASSGTCGVMFTATRIDREKTLAEQAAQRAKARGAKGDF